MIDGAVRSHKLLSDGRRQIGAFHLPGDIFGLENGDFHRFTAEAIVDTTVRLIKRQSLECVAKTNPAVVLILLSMTSDNLQHVENHLLLLERKSARERVETFLLEMNERLTSAGVIALPMTRRDIADYLGLALETVSRALSEFQQKGCLKMSGTFRREIMVLDPAGLAKLTADDGAIEIAMSVRAFAMPNVIASSPTSSAPASRRRRPRRTIEQRHHNDDNSDGITTTDTARRSLRPNVPVSLTDR